MTNYLKFDLRRPPGGGGKCLYKGLHVFCGPGYVDRQADRLYRNKGDGSFADMSASTGVSARSLPALGVVFGDFDADEDLDIYVANDGEPNLLFRNDGAWRFAEIATRAGVAYSKDGGHDPRTEPAASGYIHFANGVRGFYPCAFKGSGARDFRLEIMGSEGCVFIGNDGASIHKEDGVEPIQAPEWPVEGIPAGVQELVRLVDQGGEPVSSGTEARKTVEIIIGFLESQRRDNAKVSIASLRDQA